MPRNVAPGTRLAGSRLLVITGLIYIGKTLSFPIDIDRFSLTLVREAPDAIIFADDEGVIRFWNRGAERMFGFPEAEALGQTLDIIIPDNLRKRHWDGFTATMQSGNTRYGAGEI